MTEQRSRQARALAEQALVRLLHELRDDHIRLIVLGGLVPEILASGTANWLTRCTPCELRS